MGSFEVKSRRQTFPVTYALIALNVLVYVAMVAKGVSASDPTPQQVLAWGADFGPLTLHGQWWRLVTACFVHFGIAHVGMNMYSLYQVGRPVEAMYGRAKYLLMYAVAGLGGDLASLYMHPETVSAGASGAIFGVFGGVLAFVVVHRNEMSKAAVSSVLRSAGFVLVLNLVLGFSVKEIDLSGHVGGLVAGFAVGCFLARRGADGSMKLPVAKGLAVVTVALVVGVFGLRMLAARLPGDAGFYKAIFTGPSVPVGEKGELYFTGSATKEEAEALAAALEKVGMEDAGLLMVWDKRPGATTLLVAMGGDESKYARNPGDVAAGKRVAPWQRAGIVAGFQQVGQAVATEAGGVPYSVVLANEDGEARKTILITAAGR